VLLQARFVGTSNAAATTEGRQLAPPMSTSPECWRALASKPMAGPHGKPGVRLQTETTGEVRMPSRCRICGREPAEVPAHDEASRNGKICLYAWLFVSRCLAIDKRGGPAKRSRWANPGWQVCRAQRRAGWLPPSVSSRQTLPSSPSRRDSVCASRPKGHETAAGGPPSGCKKQGVCPPDPARVRAWKEWAGRLEMHAERSGQQG